MSPDLAVLLLAWAVATVATPVIGRIATAYGIVDVPGGRKQHDRAVPYLGGVVVFAAAGISLAVASLSLSEVPPLFSGAQSLATLGPLVLGMVALGLWDDLVDIHPGQKLAGQIVLAILAWIAGFQIARVDVLFGLVIDAGPAVSLVLTVLWIVAITNAFNFIDGIDGLAAGLATITCLTVFLLAAQANAVAALGCLALGGALAGFLRFNLPPARIFLGDAGAMAIGFSISILSLLTFQKSSTAMMLAVPLLAVGIPILDTGLAVLRRLRGEWSQSGARALHPLQTLRALGRPDRGHIHHVLLRNGFSVGRVLAALYAVSGVLGCLAVWSENVGATRLWIFVGALVVASLFALPMLERRAELRERRAAELRDIDLAAPAERAGRSASS